LFGALRLKSCSKWVQTLEAGIDEASAWYIPGLLGDHDTDVGLLPDLITRLLTISSTCFRSAFGASVMQDGILITNATGRGSWSVADARAKAV